MVIENLKMNPFHYVKICREDNSRKLEMITFSNFVLKLLWVYSNWESNKRWYSFLSFGYGNNMKAKFEHSLVQFRNEGQFSSIGLCSSFLQYIRSRIFICYFISLQLWSRGKVQNFLGFSSWQNCGFVD